MSPDVFAAVRGEHFPRGKYAIFGSGPMAARWIRPASDADIIVTQEVFDAWTHKPGWQLKTNDGGFAYLQKGPVSLWTEWRPGPWDVPALIRGAEEIDGLPFVDLVDVLRWKKEFWREKDIADAALIEKYLRPDRSRPIMIYDGHCAFCRVWIGYWRKLTGDRVSYAAFQDVGASFPEIPHERFHRSVQVAMPDGRVLEGALAVFSALDTVPGKRWLLWAYRHVPLFAPASEAAYRFISRRRGLGMRMTRLLWGKTVEPSGYVLTRWVFLRGLGLLYLIAFMSLFVQVTGIIGRAGILPAQGFLDAIRDVMGPERIWFFPTVAWYSASDLALQLYCFAGILLALLVIAGVAVLPSLIASYALYLSMVTVGQDFLTFQWDILLLEMGFLALFLAPRNLLPGIHRETKPSAAVRWLFWLLLFRFVWNSGLVKLFSGDPTWRDLTALSYHYLTQPLPNPLSWFMYHLPMWVHKGETLLTFVFELAVPFLIFAPRRARFLGAGLIIAFQAFLQITGNYTAFNLQAIALCLLLFDDAFYARLLPKRMSYRAKAVKKADPKKSAHLAATGMIALMFVLSGLLILSAVVGRGRPAGVILAFYRLISPFNIVNSYGPFAVMTTSRPEIVVEGSNDGTTWLAYEFPYKPGDLRRPPPLVAPHHPRLDWQMWFAALSDYQRTPWFVSFMLRILQGSPDVLALIEKNPFPVTPPRYIRAELYDYAFTTPDERRRTGNWWKRERLGPYFPAVSIEDFLRAAGVQR